MECRNSWNQINFGYFGHAFSFSALGNQSLLYFIIQNCRIELFILFINNYSNGYLFFRGGVVAYQIYCLNKKFSNLVSPSVNEQPEYTNCYISLSQQQTVEVEISSFLRRLLNIETFVSTILKGPKYVANDTNPWHLLRILKSNLYSLDHYQALKTLACSTYSGKFNCLEFLLEKNSVVFLSSF